MGKNVLLTAHTGADNTPDNSLEFVDYALRSGADALEVDVRRNSDGILALGHDATGESAPTLWEAFARVAERPAIKINCDLKEPGLEAEVFRLAEQAGLGGRLIFSGDFDVDALPRCPDLLKTADVYLNAERYIPDLYRNYRDIPDFDLEAAYQMCAVCLAAGIRWVNIYHGMVTRRFMEVLSRKGIGVSAWTVNEAEDLEWFFQRGAYNITTRRISTALAMRKRAL